MGEVVYSRVEDESVSCVYGERPVVQVIDFENKSLLIWRETIEDHTKPGNPIILTSGDRNEIIDIASRTDWAKLKETAAAMKEHFKNLKGK
jgi:hypothetical protein